MVKRLTFLLLIVTPVVYADWMDDLSRLIDEKERTLDCARAEEVVQKLLDDDVETVRTYDEKTKKADNSLWGKVVGLANVTQWGISKVDATYHEKVLGFIQGLPTNKKEHDGLVGDLIHLLRRNEELALLHDEYQAAQTWKEKVTIRGYIVAKKEQITTRKALIDQRISTSGNKPRAS